VDPDGTSQAAGDELTFRDHTPNGSRREPEDLGDLVDQVELG
jgi:hypothetical protein